MNTFIKATVIGNIGKMSEIRYIASGTAVLDMSVATNEKVKDDSGNWVDHTTWVNCTVWGKQSETCSQYLSVGNPVYLEGTLKLETWTDKEGNLKSSLKLNVSDVRFIHSKENAESKSASASATSASSKRAKVIASNDNIEF